MIVLQTLHALSDREAVEAVAFHLRWKAAYRYAVDAAGFHPSTLTYWRRRLRADAPRLVMDPPHRVTGQRSAMFGRWRRHQVGSERLGAITQARSALA